jgi:hypothetical protein
MTPQLLADAFTRHLRDVVGPDLLREIALLNRTQHADGRTCASHDFCDPNVCMIDAFEELMGREPLLCSDDNEVLAMADGQLIDAAWTLARSQW